jgi:hypothetical protein
MAIYNLDQNEEIDTMTINGVPYEVGDIPVRIIEKIMTIKTGFFRKDLEVQWIPICKEVLELRNKQVDLTNFTREKLFAFIQYIQ